MPKHFTESSAHMYNRCRVSVTPCHSSHTKSVLLQIVKRGITFLSDRKRKLPVFLYACDWSVSVFGPADKDESMFRPCIKPMVEDSPRRRSMHDLSTRPRHLLTRTKIAITVVSLTDSLVYCNNEQMAIQKSGNSAIGGIDEFRLCIVERKPRQKEFRLFRANGG